MALGRPHLVIAMLASVAACSRGSPSSAPSPSPSVSSAPSSMPAASASAPASDLDVIAARVRNAVAPQVGAGKNVGAVVGLRLRGETRIVPFGEVRAKSGVAPDAHTVFEIGSVTKTFTGLLLADAVESGRVHEEDRLDAFRPEWRGAASADIHLLDLVTHRSGLARLPCNLHVSDRRRPYADYTVADLVSGLATCPVGPHPSQTIAYSNWGFATLGFVLAENGHTDYPELLRTRITEPLGLHDTTYGLSADQQRRLAQGYDEAGEPTPLWERKALMGNGAIRSTADDLLSYGAALLHPDTAGPLAPAIRRALTLRYEQRDDRIAYAWFQTPAGSFWHNGATGGFSSFMKIYPSRDLVIVLLTNSPRAIKCFVSAVEDVTCKEK